MSSLINLYGCQFTFSIQWIKPNYLVISPTDAAPQVLYKLAPTPKSTSSNHARDDSIYTPFCKLDFHSRVYQGFGPCVCVCVEEGKGEGDVRRRMCTFFCKLHFPQGYMEGLMMVGERLGEFWTPLSNWPPLPGAWWGGGTYDKDFFFAYVFSLLYIQTNSDRRKILKNEARFFRALKCS